MHVGALYGEYYILDDFPRWLNVTLPHRCRLSGTAPGTEGYSAKSLSPFIRIAVPGKPGLTFFFRTRKSETITNVFRNRRFAGMFPGMWLGVSASVDVLVIQNLSSVDTFIAAPGNLTVSTQVRQAGQDSLRFILRRNAGEENASILEIWQSCQVGIATMFFFLILFGERPPVSALVLVPVMLVIILLQLFLLTPHVASLGAEVDEIPARELLRNPTLSQFQTFRRTPERPTREQEWEMALAADSANRSQSERCTKKRRKTDQNG